MKHWWVALFVSTIVLGGCGQKGPLYLPESGAGEVQEGAAAN
ncbi:LPS translocon maturation chaperone LptM [Amphritea sp. HPY]